MRASFSAIIVWAVAMLAVPIYAHEINTSYSSLEIKDGRAVLSLRIDQTDLEKLFDFDESEDGEVSGEEFQAHLDSISHYLLKGIVLSRGGEELQLQPVTSSLFDDGQGNRFVDLVYEGDTSDRGWKVTIKYGFLSKFGPRHKHLAKIISADGMEQAIFTGDFNEQSFTLNGEGPLFQQIAKFLVLGVEHIAIGYDHILFLAALIVVGGSLLNLVKIVTSFTIAHSITLILAALQVVTIPSRMVESVIALSIVYVACENFFVKNNDQRWLITFVFGLMHGFGFANVLADLGLPPRGLIISLLAFNVGVEIGQILIVALIFPLVLLISKSRWKRQMIYGLSSVILLLGLVWFIERALDVSLGFI